MSKKITILEGGGTRTFTGVNKLQTNKVGGGTQIWVPQDEASKYVSTGELSVSENGDYFASDDGYVGYSSVHVDVAGGGGNVTEISGTDPDTGENTLYTVDSTTGEITKRTVPAKIIVITPPEKTEYSVGGIIDYTGIKVGLYLNNGMLYTADSERYPGGIIPFNELVFPVTKVAEFRGDSNVFSQDGINAIRINYEPIQIRDSKILYGYPYSLGRGIDYYTSSVEVDISVGGGTGNAELLLTRYVNEPEGFYAARLSGDNSTVDKIEMHDGFWAKPGFITTSSKLDRFVYFGLRGQFTGIPVSSVDPRSVNPRSLSPMSALDIPVRWNSPYDNKIKETTFKVTENNE